MDFSELPRVCRQEMLRRLKEGETTDAIVVSYGKDWEHLVRGYIAFVQAKFSGSRELGITGEARKHRKVADVVPVLASIGEAAGLAGSALQATSLAAGALKAPQQPETDRPDHIHRLPDGWFAVDRLEGVLSPHLNIQAGTNPWYGTLRPAWPDLPLHGCQFAVGQPGDDDVWCDGVRLHGSRYCPTHHHLTHAGYPARKGDFPYEANRHRTTIMKSR